MAWRRMVASHYMADASCSRSCEGDYEEDIDGSRTYAGRASEDTLDSPGSDLVGIDEVESNVVASWAAALEIGFS